MNLQRRVYKTFNYGKIFGYQRNQSEIQQWLISPTKTDLSSYKKIKFPKISKRELSVKQEKNKISQNKKHLVATLISPLKYFPFILFIGLTGSVAANNAKIQDDLDIFIITSPGTLWIIRPFVLFYLSLLRVRRGRSTDKKSVKNLVCPNLWLDVKNLPINKNQQNLYTAHEVLLVVPLINKNHTYEKFIFQNSWVKKYLANAYKHKINSLSKVNGYISNNSFLANPLNILFFLVQYLFMLPRISTEKVSLGAAFFHKVNYQKIISQKLFQKL